VPRIANGRILSVRGCEFRDRGGLFLLGQGRRQGG